jgi:hypothetical protein
MMMANSNNDVVAHLGAVKPYGTSAAATPDSRSSLGIKLWDFIDSGGGTYIFIPGRMRGWDGSADIKLRFVWTASTATGNDVSWKIAFMRLNDGGPDIDSGWAGAAEQEVVSTAPGTCGDPKYEEKIFTAAEINGIQEGEAFRIRMRRDPSDADESMTGDAELWDGYFELLADV